MVHEEFNSTLSPMEKYEESIDLQNKCRSFYYNRVQATKQFKTKMKESAQSEKRKTPFSSAMDKLRTEMVSH